MSKKEILQAEKSIALVKEQFSKGLCNALNLYPISSPMIVNEGTGINDDLNGIERPVSFPVKFLNNNRGVVVHSLAKWKRIRLQELELDAHEGILTDMKALRPDEDSSPIHSIYVDQWDWELHIDKSDRTLSYLKNIVRKIYQNLLDTEQKVYEELGIEPILPKKLSFIHSEQLLQLYPTLSPKEREHAIAKDYGAVFIIGIGGKLSNGEPHDSRSADYDDWTTPTEEGYKGLNGDLLVWNPVHDKSLELSSMGIRVDKEALEHQLTLAGALDKKSLLYHSLLLADKLPLCIGGGLGQSRICMFLLRKKHIGEVQASIWPEEVRKQAELEGINLL
ncbi:aspartate--ammonia ligase [Myroides marinus]|uniref:aspartate--ammonia ligase n=1 Tax=Myroides marinus TaxID=703342 RepID=UPI002577128B|nr:aspartate--ammonia ligase [Myroides marinus]MDM1346387.1 aspartate--ammonia ligase [Myroides marinus]MDM1351263.1 aspartate--ammonia ligase [Myroides marinus]MDM1353987.1 aspartate--ammonia ligase [Myroides marinus]MDM1358468.1 aspartate--ammonia ligase [Myroides marinus]MDM1360514.1 aspartate--ammonia ligase [Myroides marinus]